MGTTCHKKAGTESCLPLCSIPVFFEERSVNICEWSKYLDFWTSRNVPLLSDVQF